MALPKLNVVPSYQLTIPSTGQKVSYRPYLVKEEKILLMAFESKESRAILKAMIDTIGSCIEGDIDVASLSTFDVEYMFLQIRAKSVGETSNVIIKCGECEHQNEVSINLQDINVEVDRSASNIIQLTKEISIEMKYPTYADMINSDILEEGHETNAEDVMSIVARGISAILTEEERFDTRDSTKAELDEFIDSLTSEQFAKLNDYFEAMPSLEHDVEFKCAKCGHDNKLTLKGMADFF